jgi:hypothetical protein
LPDYHAGTTAQATATSTSTNVYPVISTAFTLDSENSLPIVLGVTNTVNMPIGYAGNYMLISLCALSSGTFNQTPVQGAYGSDVSPLLLMPSALSPTGSAAFASGLSQQFGVHMFTFSTISQTASNNAIPFINGWGSATSQVGYTALYILPLDNDITSSLQKVSNFLRRQTDITSIQQMKQFAQFIEDETSSSPVAVLDSSSTKATITMASASDEDDYDAVCIAAPKLPASTTVLQRMT